MSSEQHGAVERLIHQFYYHLDHGEFDQLVALIAADGVWYRQGKVLRGPAMAREVLRERPAGVRTLHLVTNMVIDVTGAQAQATFYMTAFRHDGDAKVEGPVPVQLPFSVAVYRVKLTQTASGWRIAEMKGDVSFKR